MDNYLIDREILSEAIDKMMAGKTFPDKTPEEISALREEKIAALDEKIGLAIFGQLGEAELDQFNEILDQGDNSTSPETFVDFFNKAGIDIQKTVSAAVAEFQTELLGGQNA